MTARAQQLLREARRCRRRNAPTSAELLASLDDAADNVDDVEAACAAEIERRARRVLVGESAGIRWEDVRRRADNELRRR